MVPIISLKSISEFDEHGAHYLFKKYKWISKVKS